MKTQRLLLPAALAAAALLAGCAGLPHDLPAHPALMQAPAAPAAADASAWPEGNTWASWSDPVLAGLIETATAQQPNLQVVQARVAQARAAAQAAGAATGPQLNASVDTVDQRFSKNYIYPPPYGGSTLWNNDARLSGSWELDLFGRQRAALEAAIGQTRVAEAEAQSARLLLASNVAAAYVSLARNIEVRDLTDAALREREQVIELVHQRISAGLDTTVDLRQAEGLVAQARVELESAREQIERGRHALAELTGQPPDALAGLTPKLAAVRALPLPEGLPADLLGRRADLVAQRWRVEAAGQDVAAARAAFYPNINLTAFVGLSSIGLENFVNAGSLQYGIGPALRLPIFDGGRLRANLRSRSAEVDAAIAGYNTALLRALREVADEISSLRAIERQQRGQDEALAAAESAYDLAVQRYRAGLGNFLVVITAETNVLTQRRGVADLKARHLASEVALGRALGGGYHGEPPPAMAQAAPGGAVASVITASTANPAAR